MEARIEFLLRRYEASEQADQVAAHLTEQLVALGEPAVEPLARRLAEDLRDGVPSDYAEAVIDALWGRPEALAPLRAVFADEATPPAGRIELARALLELMDEATWREGLLAVAADPGFDPADRRRAAEILLGAGDFRVLGIIAELEWEDGADAAAEGRPALWGDEPRVTLVEERRPPAAGRPPPPGRRVDDGAGGLGPAAYVVAGAAAAGMVLLVLVFRRRG